MSVATEKKNLHAKCKAKIYIISESPRNYLSVSSQVVNPQFLKTPPPKIENLKCFEILRIKKPKKRSKINFLRCKFNHRIFPRNSKKKKKEKRFDLIFIHNCRSSVFISSAVASFCACVARSRFAAIQMEILYFFSFDLVLISRGTWQIPVAFEWTTVAASFAGKFNKLDSGFNFYSKRWRHTAKLRRWDSVCHHLTNYKDSDCLYPGKTFIFPEGGGWIRTARRTKRIPKERNSNSFCFKTFSFFFLTHWMNICFGPAWNR